MTAVRVLAVDDEEAILELLREYLSAEGMQVSVARDGRAAVEAVARDRPDVVVLDLMLPGIDGFEVVQRIRRTSDAYILMLTARAEEIDRVVGLSVGADDYLVKPFSPRELVARIRALLRRPRAAPPAPVPDRVETGGLVVDRARHATTVDSRPVELTAIEFDLLATLVADPGVVFSRQRLLNRVWGADYVGEDHVVDVHIANLRRKLGDAAARPRFIETVRGVGFRFHERGPGR